MGAVYYLSTEAAWFGDPDPVMRCYIAINLNSASSVWVYSRLNEIALIQVPTIDVPNRISGARLQSIALVINSSAQACLPIGLGAWYRSQSVRMILRAHARGVFLSDLESLGEGDHAAIIGDCRGMRANSLEIHFVELLTGNTTQEPNVIKGLARTWTTTIIAVVISP